jgi:lactose/L-arabinose transport system substrate-binding protein
MRTIIGCATLALVAGLGSGTAFAQSGELKIWSWNIAASSLESVAKDFTAANPGVKVTVEDLGNQQVFDRMLAACAAGGTDLPDIVTVENHESEIFWSQFPSCFVDLKTLGYDDVMAAQFPAFKRTEVEPGGVAYAMPWDSGPVAMFYRRDFYEKAGVDPAAIKTWADFIAAGEKIRAVSPDVVMAMADLNGDTEWFRMMANEQGCGYFSDDAQSITVNKPGCVAALETLKGMKDAGTMLGRATGTRKSSRTAPARLPRRCIGGWYEGYDPFQRAPDLRPGSGASIRCPASPPTAIMRGQHRRIVARHCTSISENKEAAFAYLKLYARH